MLTSLKSRAPCALGSRSRVPLKGRLMPVLGPTSARRAWIPLRSVLSVVTVVAQSMQASVTLWP